MRKIRDASRSVHLIAPPVSQSVLKVNVCAVCVHAFACILLRSHRRVLGWIMLKLALCGFIASLLECFHRHTELDKDASQGLVDAVLE